MTDIDDVMHSINTQKDLINLLHTLALEFQKEHHGGLSDEGLQNCLSTLTSIAEAVRQYPEKFGGFCAFFLQDAEEDDSLHVIQAIHGSQPFLDSVFLSLADKVSDEVLAMVSAQRLLNKAEGEQEPFEA